MRSLKYRAYIKDYNKVVNVDRLGLNWDGSVQEIIVSEKDLEGKNEQFELMQYISECPKQKQRWKNYVASIQI
jgi:hypothetical protein